MGTINNLRSSVAFMVCALGLSSEVGKYIPEAQIVEKQGRQKLTIELEEFAFKLRERVILEVVSDRGGQLPEAALQE